MADTNLIEICCIFDEFCKYFAPKLKSRQSQVPSANLRYLFVKNKFGCSKPQFFPWSFINSFLNMSYILY